MKRSMTYLSIMTTVLILLPGCGRVGDWVCDAFYQGCSLDYDMAVARNHIRSAKLYDQLSTVAMFDILWLSDAVRTLYAGIRSQRQGRDEDRAMLYLRRQLAENQQYITFIVLVPQYLSFGILGSSEWTLFLRIGDEKIQPVQIKSIELDYEYRAMFGDIFNRFKEAYQVRFDAVNPEGILRLEGYQGPMTLCCSSMYKRVCLAWDVQNSKLQGYVDTEKSCGEQS